MIKIYFTLLSGLIFYQNAKSQMTDEYKVNVEAADSLYRKGEYLNAAKTFSKAFESVGWKGLVNDRYNAACCWALAGIPDSSFYQLNKIVSGASYSNIDHIKNDEDLRSLHADARWTSLLDVIEKNKEKIEENFNKPLIKQLDTIFNDDQLYRIQLDSIIAEYGPGSDEMRKQLQRMNAADSINLIKVTNILNKFGWPGTKEIGAKGSITLFIVIQHADIETQEKYLPLIEKAVESGDLAAGNLALIKDRMLLRKGKEQIYGTQVGFSKESGLHYILPLSDPDNVDARRKSIGLQPLAEYVKQWNIVWDPAKYKEQLPAIKKEFQRQNIP
ncbi:DUF6624 domain-containing protein [Agriterribacter sp.]|uniref:DUF6624 domain-containing protein n=1 Tax=Agriterribacter sp. TaxID=2821509 RepID=UPI002C0E6122|nr:DUF6624 domain-containing protein [Agriterribacter sp.]HRP57654.1 hypothetical protein [Agriterribacter sp.]